MWIMIFLGGWLVVSLVVSPVIGRFILTHLKVNDEAETLNTRARDVVLERQAPNIAALDQGNGKARLRPN
jgi:hypothetical protein